MIVTLSILGLVGTLLLLRIIFFKGPMHLPVTPPPTGILDMHCHTAGFGAGDSGAWVSESLRNSWKFNLYLNIFGTNEAMVSTHGDQIVMDIIARSLRESVHVDGAVILALDAPYSIDGELNRDAGEACVPNRFVGEAVRAHPELFFGASVHPNRKDALSELEWSKVNGAIFVKWLPNIQDINPADERYTAYYNKLVELDLPLLTHVGDEDSFSKTNNALGDPQRLELALKCGVRVIAAHVASSGFSEGQDNVERLLAMMPLYPNLMADISTLTQYNRRHHLPKVLSDSRLKGRLMYGTDYPLTNTPLVSPLQYLLHLTAKQLWQLTRTRNSWDRDVRLKSALGVPPEVFHFAREVFNIKS